MLDHTPDGPRAGADTASVDVSGPLYVDGSFAPASGASVDVIDRATERTICSVASATDEQVDAALRAARSAQRAWARTSPIARGAYTQIKTAYHHHG
jgi:delta 1-pyrroline-5-carboxylate dehydrogenase